MKNEKSTTLGRLLAEVPFSVRLDSADELIPAVVMRFMSTCWVNDVEGRPVHYDARGYWPEEAYGKLCVLLTAGAHALLSKQDGYTQVLLGTFNAPRGIATARRDLDGEVYAAVTTNDNELCARVKTLCSSPEWRAHHDKHAAQCAEAEKRNAFILVQTLTGMSPHAIGLAATPFERANYTLEACAAFDKLKVELASARPTGRLVLLTGEPGTGKTYFVRGLMEELPNVHFLFVPTDLIGALSQPALIKVLFTLRNDEDAERTVIVAEDADAVLVAREEGNKASLSTLLNLTSGILGEMLDVRIIATTNAQHLEVDAALRRPGRLVDLGTNGGLSLGRLSLDSARAALAMLLSNDPESAAKATQLSSDHADGTVTLAEVYQQARRMGWQG